MSDALPKVLSFRAQRLMDSISRSTVRVPWTASGTKASGEVIQFNLPPVIMDLRSIKMYFTLSVSGAPTAAVIPVADAIIRQVDIAVSGYGVTQLPRYGKVVSQLKQLTWPTAKQASQPYSWNVDILSGPAIVQGFAYGLLSGTHQRYLDLSTFRNTTLTLTLADLTAITTLTGGTSPAVSGVTNCYLTFEGVSFAQDTYRRALRSVKHLKVPFKSISSYTSPSFQASGIDFPITKASESLDKIMVFCSAPAYQTTAGEFFKSLYDANGLINVELGGTLLNSWSLQEAQGEIRANTDSALAMDGPGGFGGIQNDAITTALWRTDYWASIYNLCLPGAQSTGLVSGVSTYYIASPIIVHATTPGFATDAVLVVALECTKSLTIDTETGELSQTE